MSCVLRISKADFPDFGPAPYRMENETAHFLVSNADFDNIEAQIVDAIAFLRSNQSFLKKVMDKSCASGVLDFAIEWRNVAVQYDIFPPSLVREAGQLGLALALSHYPQAEEQNANA